MEYKMVAAPSLHTSECLVLGILNDLSLPSFTSNFPKEQQALFQKLTNKLSEPGDAVWQEDCYGASLLLIHCGAREKFSIEALNKCIENIVSTLLKQRVETATICLPQLETRDADWQMQHMILQFDAQAYQFLDFKSKNNKPHRLKSLSFFTPNAQATCLHKAEALAQSLRLTRTLANLPANICTPSFLAEQAQALAEEHPELQTKVLNRTDMEQLGMGALLAVAQGSQEPPKLIEISYKNGEGAPVVLVGKGITFDSGGLSLKPADAMTEMKYDMAGAATVLGTLKACALLKLPINVIGLMACAENMPSGSAMRPGDVVKSMSGQTIEIINTDAEGRLVLADALTYAERFKPKFVIDIATLTGAMVIALGYLMTGFMTKDEELAELILSAAARSGDKAWRLPLDDAYQEALESPVADMVNATDRAGSSITAACFLARFAENFRWVHMDIAGTAWISGKKRNATGRPVSLLIRLLEHVAYSH
ncbi:leucyl aminopeptidase [Legionella sp. 27cVA30]|uniref:leucyl aminopeptidase n=1 Tax=Legionella sp. 27cVA30 TaxID=2905657 RepID=UPI00209E1030|nr:leucyl aminopeptidase [Legionella sp. 27cVA30]MCP0914102.1 leucyl aminopeptidase [Legionella sp. 27cVA30]